MHRDAFLARLVDALPGKVVQLHTRLCAWLIRMEACCSKVQAGKAAAPPVPDIVRARGEALFNGILLVSASSRLFRDVVALHFLIDKRTILRWPRFLMAFVVFSCACDDCCSDCAPHARPAGAVHCDGQGD